MEFIRQLEFEIGESANGLPTDEVAKRTARALGYPEKSAVEPAIHSGRRDQTEVAAVWVYHHETVVQGEQRGQTPVKLWYPPDLIFTDWGNGDYSLEANRRIPINGNGQKDVVQAILQQFQDNLS